MRILVCVKRVPAPGAKINVTPDGRAVDSGTLGFTTSPHEECAVEEAVLITERLGRGEVTILSLGPPEAEEQLRYGASVGGHNLVLVATETTAWDPQRTAAALTQAIEALENIDGTFDLILFGNESADSGGFQVGVRVSHALGRPMVNGIKSIDIEEDTIVARRETDAGIEIYRLPRPAVLGVKEGINLPRYPTMRGRLASKKAAVRSLNIDANPGGQATIRLHKPEEVVSEPRLLATDRDDTKTAAARVVDLLEDLGLLA